MMNVYRTLGSVKRLLEPARLRQVLADPDRKPVSLILWQAGSFWVSKREVPHRYIESFGYRAGVEPEGLLSSREYRALRVALANSPDRTLIADKALFAEHFGKAPGVRLPLHLGYVENGIFHDADGASQPAKTMDEVRGALTRLFKASQGRSVFVKPTDGSEGKGMFKLFSAEPDQVLVNAFQEGRYVLQAAVENHPALAAVMPDTLNTMRITTCRLQGEPVVGSAWIRYGRSGAIVDNASSGGLFAAVDLATGTLQKRSMTKLNQGAKVFTRHPDTGHPLVGFEVPAFADALEMARAAARHTSHPLVGWDVAIDPEGPVIIEGNARPMVHSDEMVNGGYLTHPVFGPFIEELTGGKGLGRRPG